MKMLCKQGKFAQVLLQNTDSSRAPQPGRSHPREDGLARSNALRRIAAVARQNLAAGQAGPRMDEGPGRRCMAQMSGMGCLSTNCPRCPSCQLPHRCCVLRHPTNQRPDGRGGAGGSEPLERPPDRRGSRQQQQPQQQYADPRSRRSRQRARARERERARGAERVAHCRDWSEAPGLLAGELRERATREASARLLSLVLQAQAAQRRSDSSHLGSTIQSPEEKSKASQVGEEDGQPTVPITSGSNEGNIALSTNASGLEGGTERRRHPNWSPPSPIRFPGQPEFNNVTRPIQDCVMPQVALGLDINQDSGMGQSCGMGSNDSDDRPLSTPTHDNLGYSPEVHFDG